MSQESITASEDALFAEWRQTIPSLVSDGVVDEATFLLNPQRLVFVLKEVNDRRDGGRWDLREFVRHHAHTTLWTRIAGWVHGIRRLPGDVGWDEIRGLNADKRAQALSSICAMNLKKSPGSYVADEAQVAETARRDASLLMRQIALYSPATFIWCGVEPRHLYESHLRWACTARGVPFARTASGDLIVRYVHPTIRAPGHLVHYGLMDAVREIGARDAACGCATGAP